MAAEDGARWDARYGDRDTDVQSVGPDVLVDADLDDLMPTTGRALDVACGLGSQSIWMAQRGLSVVALDVSATAIENLRARAQDIELDRHGHSDDRFAHRVDARQHDLDTGLPSDDPFDVIVCQRFRDPRLYPEFVARLRPGGLLVVTVLSQTGATDPGPFHAPAGELRTAFDVEGCTIVHHAAAGGQESIVVSSHV